MRRFIIYAWICPETDKPVYVGKTCRTISWRMRSHFLDAIKHPDKPKYVWLNAAKERGQIVLAKEMERCAADESAVRERYWIDRLSSDGPLLNVAKGGGGGHGPENVKWTAEMIARLGVDFDTDIARDVGCTYQTVAYRRECLGIPARRGLPPARTAIQLPQGAIDLLGLKQDHLIASEWQLKPSTVARARRILGIASFTKRAWRAVPSSVLLLLGTDTDQAIAKLVGCSVENITSARLDRGIPAMGRTKNIGRLGHPDSQGIRPSPFA